MTTKDFPFLRTMKAARAVLRPGQYQPCHVCHLAVSPRNRRPHGKACARRKRQAPLTWLEWKLDMNGVPEDDPRRPDRERLYAEGVVKRPQAHDMC